MPTTEVVPPVTLPALAPAAASLSQRVTQRGGRLGLDDIRNDLIRQEETIIFGLIERSQYAHNEKIYQKGGFPFLAEQSGNLSFMEFFLLETEKLHAMCSRYQCPDENAFFPALLPTPVLAPVRWPKILEPNTVNVNSRIMSLYVDRVLPQIAHGGVSTDDTQYGSSAVSDINVLQAISKRVHFGKFVAEAKFQAETEKYTGLIQKRDVVGIMEALTNSAVEERLLRRVRHKAQMYGSEIEDEGRCEDRALKVDPEVIVEVYRDFLIPLTKDVEVEYLLRRCGPVPVAIVAGAGGCREAATQIWHLDDENCGVGPVTVSPIVPYAFEEVRAGHVAWACVPLETSGAGVVKATVAEFLKEVRRGHESSCSFTTLANVTVLGEIYIPATFTLLRRRDVELREVAAEAEVLRLCQDALQERHRGLVLTPVLSAAEALERANARAYVGAIVPDDGRGPEEAAPDQVGALQREVLHGTAINHFIVIGQGPCAGPSGRDRTLVLFALRDSAGALVEALQAFEGFGVNLSGIHSFLMPSEDGAYVFLVQADGHKDEKPLTGALSQLHSCAAVSMMCVLGSFPAAPVR